MLFSGIYEGGRKGIFCARDFSMYNLLIFCLAKPPVGGMASKTCRSPLCALTLLLTISSHCFQHVWYLPPWWDETYPVSCRLGPGETSQSCSLPIVGLDRCILTCFKRQVISVVGAVSKGGTRGTKAYCPAYTCMDEWCLCWGGQPSEPAPSNWWALKLLKAAQ